MQTQIQDIDFYITVKNNLETLRRDPSPKNCLHAIYDCQSALTKTFDTTTETIISSIYDIVVNKKNYVIQCDQLDGHDDFKKLKLVECYGGIETTYRLISLQK